MQRVRVGMTGLAVVLVLIGLASAILSSANREEPVAAAGASNALVVANMTDPAANSTAEQKVPSEPLAELGVAPPSDSSSGSVAAVHEEAATPR